MKIKLLVVTTLYPNKVQYRHGIFVETRLRHLLDSGRVEAQVIAPVPWFPFRSKRFSQYSIYRDVPNVEQRNGITIYHPRYLVVPKIGMLLTPFFLAISILLAVLAIKRTGFKYDIVDSHYYYPDGVAVALIAKWLKTPFTVTARGTDINLIPEKKLPRKIILWAANKAAASITVCAALKDRMIELGADKKKIKVLRNGVDLEFFNLLDKNSCRREYQLQQKTLLSVGHLIARKGHDLVIKAMVHLKDCELLIAGDGEEEEALKKLVKKLGVEQQVKFLGAVTQQELVGIYNAVDVMVLASSREGWANVLLESMACGTPVVASDIWGTPEVVKTNEAGLLMKDRTPECIAASVKQLFNHYPNRDATRKYAEQFSWGDTVAGLLRLFEKVAA